MKEGRRSWDEGENFAAAEPPHTEKLLTRIGWGKMGWREDRMGEDEMEGR